MNQPRGSALIIVMWLMVLLSVVVAHYSREVRIETDLATDYIQREKAYYLALAGTQRAILEISRDTEPSIDTLKDSWHANPEAYKDVPVGHTGTYSVQVVDEDGKIDLNSVDHGVLSRLLYAMGVKRDQLETIVDSILDWMDEDDIRRLKGAENDFYEKLDPPYQSKDGPFDSVLELLLVQGVTEDIFWGYEGEDGFVPGLVDLVTVYQSKPVININTAPGPVLEAVLGVGASTVEAILHSRDAGSSSGTPSSLKTLSTSQAGMPMVTFSRNFGVTSTGTVSNSGTKRTVRAIVSRERGVLRVIAWDDLWERIAIPYVLDEDENDRDKARKVMR